MDPKLESLRRGLFKVDRKPGLLKQVTLESFLCTTKLDRKTLIKEIAYSLVTPLEDRLDREVWRIAYYGCPIANWYLKSIYYKKGYKSLVDITIVDIEILNKPTDRETLYSTHSWLYRELIRELKLIETNGKQL